MAQPAIVGEGSLLAHLRTVCPNPRQVAHYLPGDWELALLNHRTSLI